MRKKILVLGGTGFIGSAVLQKLNLLLNKFEVMVIAHRNVPYQKLENFNLYLGDLKSLDLKIIDAFQPDCILHMARISGRNRLGRKYAAKRGFKANQRLAEHLIQNHSQVKLIYVSGTLIYGDCGSASVTEDSAKNPTAFAKEYMHAEAPWRQAQAAQKLNVSMLIPPWIIGSGSWFKAFYINYMQKWRAVPLLGEGENWMSLLDVEDCAGLILKAVTDAKANQDYNLFTANCHLKMKSFVEQIANYTTLPIHKFTAGEVKKRFGKTVYEAFTFSLKSDTTQPDFIKSYNFTYRTVNQMIAKNLKRAGWQDEI